MLRGILVSAALLPMLGGCVSQVQLANDKGQMAQCSAAGLGIISSMVAASVQHNCIAQYQKQGYHQVAAATPSATTTESAAAPSAAPKKPTKASTSGKVQAAQCSSFGMGLVGSLVAASMQQTCMTQHQAGAPAASSAPASAK